jgi:hypothetical protein
MLAVILAPSSLEIKRKNAVNAIHVFMRIRVNSAICGGAPEPPVRGCFIISEVELSPCSAKDTH